MTQPTPDIIKRFNKLQIPNLYLSTQQKIHAFLLSETSQARNEVLGELEEEVKKMWDYPCDCLSRQMVCTHNYSTMKNILSLIASKKTDNKEIK